MPLPSPEAAVAGRAINVEATLAALNILLGDGDRKLVDVLAVDFAGVARLVDAQVPSRHGSFHHRPRGAAVGEEIACSQRLVARLILHVLAAGGEQHQQSASSCHTDKQPLAHARGSVTRGT